jgi:hypothetical protein
MLSAHKIPAVKSTSPRASQTRWPRTHTVVQDDQKQPMSLNERWTWWQRTSTWTRLMFVERTSLKDEFLFTPRPGSITTVVITKLHSTKPRASLTTLNCAPTKRPHVQKVV